MKREDLFAAIGQVEEERLAQCEKMPLPPMRCIGRTKTWKPIRKNHPPESFAAC